MHFDKKAVISFELLHLLHYTQQNLYSSKASQSSFSCKFKPVQCCCCSCVSLEKQFLTSRSPWTLQFLHRGHKGQASLNKPLNQQSCCLFYSLISFRISQSLPCPVRGTLSHVQNQKNYSELMIFYFYFVRSFNIRITSKWGSLVEL